MKLVLAVLLTFAFGCAPAPKPTPTRFAFPQVDGKQYMTIQVEPDRRLVLAVDTVWSCTAAGCTVVPPQDVGTQPSPGNCPCTNRACAEFCDPDQVRKLPAPRQDQ